VESFAELELVCVYLLCVELAHFARLYQLSYILKRGWPVKPMPKGFTDQRAG